MDYEKPEAVHPQIVPHTGQQSPQPDGEATLHNFDESSPDDRREFRGDSLWYSAVMAT
jgi:amino acid transporter